MSAVYYIISKDNYYVARNMLDKYRAYDFVDTFYHEYGGKLRADNAITFDTKEEAMDFINRDSYLQLKETGFVAKKYDINLCTFIADSKEETQKSTNGGFIDYDTLFSAFRNYVLNDLEASDEEYVRESLNAAGLDDEMIVSLGFSDLVKEQER